MIIIPAIDLKDGACVRLEQGRMDKATVFSKEPGKTASQWAQKGARRLHVVDLNGAMVGKPRNEAAIKQIIAAVDSDIPVQLGGGIRDLDTIEPYLDDGVSYIDHRHGGGEEPRLPARGLRRLPGPHHGRAGREGRQGRHRRLVETHGP
jgi:phosphoribosylformimino-5-aminoimidazole carboxamide ribonucleotide (ProFAR) isomerase